MSLVFQKATVADIPDLILLQQQIWEPTYRALLSPEQIDYMFQQIYSPAALTSQLTEQGHVFVLAYAGDARIGFAAYSAGHPTEQRYKLHKLYVLPTGQGKGWGRQLLDEVVRQCRELGGQRLQLNVNRDNKARWFYEKMGFSVVREEDIPIGPYWMNDYVMEKDLTTGPETN